MKCGKLLIKVNNDPFYSDEEIQKITLPITALGKSWCDDATDGFIKLIVKDEKKIEKLEAELKKDPEPEKEEPKKPPIEIENHEEKPLTVNEAFKNLFG